MQQIKILYKILILSFILLLKNTCVLANSPMPIDSRIKTFIYSPNEIFQVKFMVNYQSIIELEKDEEVELITFGDPVSWNIKVLTRRIFIKATDPGVKTNMTIITNKRTYLMEISSTLNGEEADDKVIFILRFFYPDINVDLPNKKKETPKIGSIKINDLSKKAIAMAGNAMINPNNKEMIDFNPSNFNGNYAYSGKDRILVPEKVFDDGIRTFIKFNEKELKKEVPLILEVTENGEEIALELNRYRDMIYFNKVVKQFAIKLNDKLICIFNDNLSIKNNGYVREKR